jgi:hypothetical protein
LPEYEDGAHVRPLTRIRYWNKRML